MTTPIQRIFMILCCTVTVLIQSSCLRDSYLVKISGAVTIGDQWVECRPDSPLKAEKDFQLVLLDLEPPLKDDFYSEGKGLDKGKGILTPEGNVVNPEVELTDKFGNTFSLVYRGATGIVGSKENPLYGLPPDELPRDREYTLIRLKSARPIKCSAIYWFCESGKDWK